ncbi:bifunctional diguanylate cyclase/phosphodiesterase [Actinotalea sp. K2]|uniref:putative bifunctional diguanylate cyclase/phosphodiesterase n=1 Tax=Actinotalea sp. K2 TaxID=2939438 RepID=UPI002017E3C5|nr:EAL domain-containing protein [Actinotalea sp. K2]MCL3861050.1 EAL domain-containing protein [Actinotalea sp. K2]
MSSPPYRTTAEQSASVVHGDDTFLRSLLDTSEEVIYFKDLQSRFVRVSLGCARLHRRTQAEMVGISDHDLFSEVHALAARADELRIIETGVPMLNHEERESWFDRPDTWVASSKFPWRDAEGQVIGTFGISRDVTRRVQVEQEVKEMAAATTAANAELRRVEAQLRAVLNSSTDAIAKYDGDLRYQYINPAGEHSRGATLADLIGRTDRETGMAESSLQVWEPALRRVLETGEPDDVEFAVSSGTEGEETWFHTTVSPDRDASGAIVGVLTSVRDITDIKRAEQALAHQAMHDSVTGLANRYLLMDRLEQAVVRMARYPSRLALFFVDLDHFKSVNDTYGHEVGDHVLIEFARRLEHVARREDTVARLGGDEFVVLCDRVMTDHDVAEIGNRVVRALAEPFVEGPVSVRLSASVGAVVTDDPQARASDLLRSADTAMYRAKQDGRNRFQVFDPQSADHRDGGATLESELRQALADGEFRLVYQPLLSLSNQRVLGFEALIRWHHPSRGVLTPKDFLDVAEERGLIGLVGDWVLDTACAQLARWTVDRDPGARPLSMAVNIAGAQLREPGFAQRCAVVVAAHGLVPGQLCLEITERDLVQDGPDVREALEALAELGVQLAVDDFGTTYTSLARLPQFPVSIVKLESIGQDVRDRGVAAAVIAMAHGLGMSVVGEGIETVDQLTELVELACDEGQGFLLGRPLATRDVSRLLSADAAASRADDASRHLGRR